MWTVRCIRDDSSVPLLSSDRSFLVLFCRLVEGPLGNMSSRALGLNLKREGHPRQDLRQFAASAILFFVCFESAFATVIGWVPQHLLMMLQLGSETLIISPVLRMHFWWSVCTLYLNACQVRATVGDSGLCCICVKSFER